MVVMDGSLGRVSPLWFPLGLHLTFYYMGLGHFSPLGLHLTFHYMGLSQFSPSSPKTGIWAKLSKVSRKIRQRDQNIKFYGY